jgi:hypothetical protein
MDLARGVDPPHEDDGNRVPEALAPLFQEYRLQELSLQADRDLVIERVLAYGNREEVRWLLRRYGRAAVVDWLAERAPRLPKRRHALWCVIFDVPVAKPTRTTGIWRH